MTQKATCAKLTFLPVCLWLVELRLRIAELFPRFKDNKQVLRAMYGRAMVDLEALLHNHSCKDEGFNEMSRLNTTMLSYILTNWKDVTYHIEDDPEVKKQPNIDLQADNPIDNLNNFKLVK